MPRLWMLPWRSTWCRLIQLDHKSRVFFQQTWKLVIWNMMQDCRFYWNMTSFYHRNRMWNLKMMDSFLSGNCPKTSHLQVSSHCFVFYVFLDRLQQTLVSFYIYDCNSQKIRHTSKKIRLQSLFFFENNLIENNQNLSINLSMPIYLISNIFRFVLDSASSFSSFGNFGSSPRGASQRSWSFCHGLGISCCGGGLT